MKKDRGLIWSIAALVLTACGGGGSSSSVTTAPTNLSSTFLDAPVTGLCYSASPSGKSGVTDSSGNFSYLENDTVTFWVDGSGSDCNGTTSATATSVQLGSITPTGVQSFVLSLPQGVQVSQTLTALNIGSNSAMNVGGIKVASTDVANINTFISSGGNTLPASASGSVDLLFKNVQANAAPASNSGSLPFVTSLASATSSTSLLEVATSNNLATSASSLNMPANSLVNPSNSLRYFVVESTYYHLLPTTTGPFTASIEGFIYFGSGGTGYAFESPSEFGESVTPPTLSPSATLTLNSYSISGNTIIENLTGVLTNGYTVSELDTFTFTYQDSSTGVYTGPIQKVLTSGPNSGKEITSGQVTGVATNLTPLTLAMLAGHTVTLQGTCSGISGTPGNSIIVFSSDGATATETCSANNSSAVTSSMATTLIPGILEHTNTSGDVGNIVYMGLIGTGLTAGSSLVIVSEACPTNNVCPPPSQTARIISVN
jgi:hypothetical protein